MIHHWQDLIHQHVSLLYMFWLVFVGAGCLALVALHNGEKDYLSDDDDEMDIW